MQPPVARPSPRSNALPEAFQILDSADQLALIKRVLKALNIDDEKYPPKQLQHFINGNGKTACVRTSTGVRRLQPQTGWAVRRL